ncbi:fungal hydrophobin [Colletotrichum tofieldiae]|nr:fungal hydrophobin [Colletotrichum tofieldiae]
MQFTIAIAALFASVALSARSSRNARPPTSPAPCCATDVLGIADLDCGNPPQAPTSADEFSSVCSAIGQRARCCVLPILDQGILCNTPTGVQD